MDVGRFGSVAHAVHRLKGRRFQIADILFIYFRYGTLRHSRQNQVKVGACLQPLIGIALDGTYMYLLKPALHLRMLGKIIQLTDIPKLLEHVRLWQLNRADEAHADKNQRFMGDTVERTALWNIENAVLMHFMGNAIDFKRCRPGTDIPHQRIGYMALLISPFF